MQTSQHLGSGSIGFPCRGLSIAHELGGVAGRVGCREAESARRRRSSLALCARPWTPPILLKNPSPCI